MNRAEEESGTLFNVPTHVKEKYQERKKRKKIWQLQKNFEKEGKHKEIHKQCIMVKKKKKMKAKDGDFRRL